MVAKFSLLAFMFYHIYTALATRQTDLKTLWQLLVNALNSLRAPQNFILVLFCVLFAPLNWAFESLKWQTLAQRVEPISFSKAYQGVLAGLAIGFVLPNHVGDAAGRVMSLRHDHRYESIGAALLSNALQLFVSVFGGFLALVWLMSIDRRLATPATFAAASILAVALIFGVLLIWKKHESLLFLKQFGWFNKIKKFVQVIGNYHVSEIIRALGYAFLRYFTFSFQFYFLLIVFNVQLPFHTAIACIMLVFLGKTLIPAFNFLSDLGVREFTSIYVFGFFNCPPTAIVLVTLSLWIINLLLPSLVGVLAFWKLK